MICPNETCSGKIEVIDQGLQGAPMDYLSVHGCFVCPYCETEVWIREEEDNILDLLRKDAQRQKQMRTKKSSSRKAGRKPKTKTITKAWYVRE